MSDNSNVQAALEFAKDNFAEHITTVDGVGAAEKQTPILMKSGNRTPVDIIQLIEKFNGNPVRATGKTVHTTEESFCKHVNRFKTALNTVLFADSVRPFIKAVYNYNAGFDTADADGVFQLGKPGFGDHTAEYAPEFSREWENWVRKEGEFMSQDALAQHFEDNAFDIIPVAPDPLPDTLAMVSRVMNTSYANGDEIIAQSRAFRLREVVTIGQSRVSSNGDVFVNFSSENGEDAAQQKFRGLFLIGIPVFMKGPGHILAVRIQYKKKQIGEGQQGLDWKYTIYRKEQNLDIAYTEVLERIKSVTGVPMFHGAVK